MSDLRQRAREVTRQGAVARRNWNPDPGSSHYKVYRWWLARTRKPPLRENFCHYWRVVCIWAPLRWLAKPLMVVAALALVALVIYAIVRNWPVSGWWLLAVPGIAYVIIGVKVFGHLMYEVSDEDLSDFRWRAIDDKGYTVIGALLLATLPVAIFCGVVLLVLGAFFSVLIGLQDEYRVYSKIKDWFVGAQVFSRRGLRWVRPWHVVPATMMVLSIWYPVAFRLFLIMLVIAAVFGLFALISWMVDSARTRAAERRIVERQEQQKKERRQLLEIKFAILHPKRAGSKVMFEQWLEHYEHYFQAKYGRTVWEAHEGWHLQDISDRYYTYQRKLQKEAMRSESMQAVTAQPSWLSRVATGTGDFFVLLWSFILTRKWKICPIVEIPR